MSSIYGSNTRVSVIVSVHAKAERIVIPQGGRSPVATIMTKAIHSLRQTLLLHASLFIAFTLLFALTFFF